MKDNPHKDFSYSDTAKQLKKLFRQLYTYKSKGKTDGIIYNGEDIKSSSILATSFNISKSFTPESFEYNKNQGRDSLDVFINKVFQLGYSVGYENCKDDHSSQLMLAREVMEKRTPIELSSEVSKKINDLWKNLNNE